LINGFWNLLGKRQYFARFFFVGLSLSALYFSPLLLVYPDDIPLIPTIIWAWSWLIWLLEVIYYIGHTEACQLGDIALAHS
jgi:hypothetical protein